jgi:hypothetical protein
MKWESMPLRSHAKRLRAMMRMTTHTLRPSWRVMALLILLFGIFVGQTFARELWQGEQCTLAEGETMRGTMFVLCENLQIEGHVTGDVIGLALRATITGNIDGDIYLGGGELDIQGRITGNIHYGGVALNILPPETETQSSQSDTTPSLPPQLDVFRENRLNTGQIGGDLYSVTLSTHLHADTQLLGGVLAFGFQFINDGIIEREVNYWGSALRVSGRINSDVYADVGDPNTDGGQIETLLLPLQFDIELGQAGMQISDNAVIRGELQYRAPATGTVEGRIIGGVNFSETSVIVLPTLEEPGSLQIYFDQFTREASTLMSIGLLLVLIAPSAIQQPLSMMRSRPVPSIIVGMLSFILSFPIILILLVLTIALLIVLEVIGLHGVTIAAGIVLGLANVGGISIFYFLAIFVARTLVGLAIGRVLLRIFMNGSALQHRMSVQIIVGTLLLALSASLPLIGWVFNALALFIGLGAILTIILDKFQQMRSSTPQTAPFGTPAPAKYPRPVMPNVPIVQPVPRSQPDISPQDLHTPTGMNNLPSGFDESWFFDARTNNAPKDAE